MESVIRNMVDNEESVARILSNGWVVNGILQHTAFMLREGETYISVNRPAVNSYNTDAAKFVKYHKNFATVHDNTLSYQRAILQVGDIRNISIAIEGLPLAVNVEVEPRDLFTRSHAGIFTRYYEENIKVGNLLYISQEKNVSANMVLLKVRLALMRLSTIETCSL